jgi:hypothetical protein
MRPETLKCKLNDFGTAAFNIDRTDIDYYKWCKWIGSFVLQNKPQLVEPIDFETFILRNKTVLQNDPQRELLLYPLDDVSVSTYKCIDWT